MNSRERSTQKKTQGKKPWKQKFSESVQRVEGAWTRAVVEIGWN